MSQEPSLLHELRTLLNEPNRDTISLHVLEDTTPVTAEDFALGNDKPSTHDTAIIVIGPKNELNAIFRENTEAGTTTLEVELPGLISSGGTT